MTLYEDPPGSGEFTLTPPGLAPGQDTPFNYVFAQLRQAQNLWNAGRVTSGGEMGMDQFTFTPRPLDKTIKSIIRPTDGAPRVR